MDSITSSQISKAQYSQICRMYGHGSSQVRKAQRMLKVQNRAKKLEKYNNSEDNIDWSTLGLRSNEELEQAILAAQNSCTQLENGWSVPQDTVASHYNKSIRAKPALASNYSNIEIEAQRFISLWESRGYVTLRGPIGTAKCIFSICSWIMTSKLPRLQDLVDDAIFCGGAHTDDYHMRRRIIQFISLSLNENVAYQFTGYIDKPTINVPRTLFVDALRHFEKLIPSFHSSEHEMGGYIDVIPEFQQKFNLSQLKKSFMFSVLNDAKEYVQTQVYDFFSHYGMKIVAVAVGAIVCIIGFAILVPHLARVVCKWAMGEQVDEVPEHQGKDSDAYIPVLSDVTKALTKYMNGPLGNVNAWTSEIAKAGTQLRNIEYLMNFVITKFTYMVDYVSIKIYGSPFLESSKKILWATEELPRLEMELEAIQTTQLTRISSKRVVEIYKELSNYVKLYLGMGPIGASAKYSVEQVSKMYYKMFESACQAVYSPKMRVEPVWVHILGPPDMGKSTFAYALSATVMKELYGSFDQSDVYPVNEENTYFDGFYGQKVLFIDEHLAKGDTAERAMRAEKIIHIVNSMPYPLMSAGLEDKGKHWIESDLVITTNNDDPYPANLGLKDPNAYFRRRSLVLKLYEREGDTYMFEMFASKPPPNGDKTTYKVNGDQVTKMVVDLIQDKRRVYHKLQDKTTNMEEYRLDLPETHLRFRGTKKRVDDEEPSEPVPLSSSHPHYPHKSPQLTNYDLDDGKLKGKPTKKAFMLKQKVNIENIANKTDKAYLTPVYIPSNIDGTTPEQQMYQPEDDPPVTTASSVPLQNSKHNRTEWDKVEAGSQFPHIRLQNNIDWMAFKDKERGLDHFATCFNKENELMIRTNIKPLKSLVEQSSVIFKKRGSLIIHSYAPTMSVSSAVASYIRSYTIPYHQTGADLELSECLDKIPFHATVMDTPYNRQFWQKFCVRHGVPVLPFEHLMTVCQYKLTYGELSRLYNTTPQEENCSFQHISLNGRTFLARWFFGTAAIFGLMTHEELSETAKLLPSLLPYTSKQLKDGLKVVTEIWTSRFGLTKTIVDRLKDPLFIMGSIVAGATLTAAASAIITWLMSSGARVNTEIELQSDNKHMANVLRKTLRSNRRQRQKKQTLVVESQSDDTVQFQSLNMGLTDKVANNVEHIVVVYDDGSQASQFALFLFGNKFVTASHPFLRKDKKPIKMIFSFAATMPYETPISSVKMKFDADRDLVFAVVENFPVLFADITKKAYIRSADSRPSPGTSGAIRIQFTSDGSLHLLQGPAVVDYNGPSGDEEHRMNLKSCFKIGVGGVKGMCGLPYIYDNTMVGFIGGIHVAGTKDFSVFSPIFLEDMELFSDVPESQSEPIALGDFNLPDPELLKLIKPTIKQFSVIDKPGPCPLGVRTVAESNHMFIGPSSTKLRQSLVGESPSCPFEKDMAPAALKPFVNAQGETISPLNVAFKKFENKALKSLPDEFYEPDVTDGIFTPDKPWDRLRFLTVEEAINGVPEWENCHAIDMTTSAGVGYINQGLNRKDLFDKVYSKRYDREIYVPKYVLKDQIDRMYADVRRGVVPRCMALGLLKDEKRPKQRVEAGASRLFYAADLAHLIVSRMVCGGLLSAGEVNPSQSDIMVGINPLGVEWKLLFDRITNKGKFNLTSTDIEGWDINFILSTTNMFIRGMEHKFPLLSKIYVRAVHCILRSSVNPFVFIGQKVFWMWIMCSGCLMTSYFNSAANSMLHRGLFKIMKKRYLDKIDSGEIQVSNADYTWLLTLTFDQAIKAGFFGDDNTQGVDPRLKDMYNGQTLASARLELLNWVTTDPFKKKEISKYDKYEDTVLLKRFFRLDGPHIKPSLDKKAIEGIAMWYMKGTNPDTTQQAINLHVALRESYYWGEEYFNMMFSVLQPHLQELSKLSGTDHTFKYTYKQLDEQFEESV